MERAVAVVEVATDGQFGQDFIRRKVRDLNADQTSKWRLQFCVGIHFRIHGGFRLADVFNASRGRRRKAAEAARNRKRAIPDNMSP
jgi:hypothetical protein